MPAAETAGALRDLIIEGKIGHVGVSNFNACANGGVLRDACRWRPLQPPYHLFRREIEDDELPYCRQHNIGVLVYGPLAHGLLTGTLSTHTAFAADDWRSTAAVFSGGHLSN